MLSDNSPIQGCLGDGNKIVSISVATLCPFFSQHSRNRGTDRNVSIRPCPSSGVPAPSIHTEKR